MQGCLQSGWIRFNSQPPEGGWPIHDHRVMLFTRFQLTAARRRLVASTNLNRPFKYSFNSQPPEGGWSPCRKGFLL